MLQISIDLAPRGRAFIAGVIHQHYNIHYNIYDSDTLDFFIIMKYNNNQYEYIKLRGHD